MIHMANNNSSTAEEKMKQYLCVGTYTDPILFGTGQTFYGKGQGIYFCSFEDGRIEVLKCLKLTNPSYFCMDQGYKKIYAVNEAKEYQGQFGGGVTQVSFKDGILREEFSTNSGGTDPCHIEMSPDRSFLSVANFASGSVSIFPLDKEGNMIGERRTFQHEGSSVHPVRQKGPHAHGTIFQESRSRMLVPDLGIDKIKIYAMGKDGIMSALEEDVETEPGSGPRFGVFSRNGRHFYLIHELASSVVHYRCEERGLVFQQKISTLPEGFPAENNICSDLHLTPDERYLYASNRGHDSICCFRVEKNGDLELIERVCCGGKTPRNFCVDPFGQYVLAGNQESDTIVVFSIGRDGRLAEKQRVGFPSPVCIRFF